MSTPVLFTLALVTLYVGVTLTFLKKEESREASLRVPVRSPIQQVSR
jgi:hypothetical protein